MATVTLQKARGAFYTDKPATSRLVTWAIWDRNNCVLDPSCGDGAFLSMAETRLRELGSKSPVIFGVDVSEEAIRDSRERIRGARLFHQNFFDLSPGDLPKFDSVVGNPPFIRYQTFNGDERSKGQQRAREAGVKLPGLASSWAPFVVHASRFLRLGGRLAMVMPAELGHAMYARDVLKFLVRHFRHVAVEMFRNKIFSELGQSTVLLFCDGYGEPCTRFLIASSDDISRDSRQAVAADVAAVEAGRFRFTHYVIPGAARDLYRRLAATKGVERLGDIAKVGIGYVTGANNFFHLSAEECRMWGIPHRFLKPCVLNLRGFSDFEYHREHWTRRRATGDKVYLLSLPSTPAENLPGSVRRYLESGVEGDVWRRYKCQVREFWYSVPHVRIADAFLSYMSGEQPLLVSNAANLVAPNTMHTLRFMRDADPLASAVAWRSSLTRLSCELEGHALGGGLFKLEPSEAENVLVVHTRRSCVRSIISQVQALASTSADAIRNITDRFVLKRQLGLTGNECALLQEAALKAEAWRKHRQ